MERTEERIYNIKDLKFSYGDNTIFDGISLDIKKGKITTFLGGNGCGKSTLFNLMTKNLKSGGGEIDFCGRSLENIKLKDFAKEAAIVHQKNTAPADIQVKKLVSYGRTPHRSNSLLNFNESEDDEEIINWAMSVTNTEKYSERAVSALSGGQMQRVWIAMALAQETEILFLDEPTTFLDIRYQLEVLKLVKKLNKKYGKTVIMVLHDINQALAYSDEIIALKDGQVLAQGNPQDIVADGLLQQVYGVEMNITEVDGDYFVLPV